MSSYDDHTYELAERRWADHCPHGSLCDCCPDDPEAEEVEEQRAHDEQRDRCMAEGSVPCPCCRGTGWRESIACGCCDAYGYITPREYEAHVRGAA